MEGRWRDVFFLRAGSRSPVEIVVQVRTCGLCRQSVFVLVAMVVRLSGGLRGHATALPGRVFPALLKWQPFAC